CLFPLKTEVGDNTNLDFLQHILADLFLIVLLGWPSHKQEDNFLGIARDVPVFLKVPFRCFGHSLSDVTRFIKPQLPHCIRKLVITGIEKILHKQAKQKRGTNINIRSLN
ncbi:hypothetical protein M758_UG155100, partial [Ceratodon purpureus]